MSEASTSHETHLTLLAAKSRGAEITTPNTSISVQPASWLASEENCAFIADFFLISSSGNIRQSVHVCLNYFVARLISWQTSKTLLCKQL
jgi:hypothetical protein